MNRKGATMFLGVAAGVFIFLFGMIFLDFIEDETEQAILSNTTLFPGEHTDNLGGPGLNCGSSDSPNTDISDGTQLTCLATELVVPYFIIIVLSVAGGAMVSRFVK
jgi:hypothetical protein